MTQQYFRIDEYFTADQESKKHLAYFVLANMIFKDERINNIIGSALVNRLAYNSTSVVNSVKEIVKDEVRKLSERLSYPFNLEPIQYLVLEMVEYKMDPFYSKLRNINKYAKPKKDLSHFINIAQQDEMGLKDLIELFGYFDEQTDH